MKDICRVVAAYCQDHALLHQGDTIVVACSGGPDSLALLDVLARLRTDCGIRLVVCYVHHGIRQAADDEARIVAREAARRQCAYVCFHADVPALARTRHISLETAGREERYRLLRQAAAQYGASAIAVAHHQNDQAETVLLHVLRGSGLAGLGGMAPKNGDIIRPFLCLTRQDIEQYGRDRNLSPCCDESNYSAVFARNRIRLELLPCLQQYNPGIVADLTRMADIVRADDAYIRQCAQEQYDALKQSCDGGAALDKRGLLAQPLAIQRRLLRLLCRDVTGTEQDIPFHYIETMRALAAKGAGKQFQTGTVQVYTTRQALCAVRAALPPRRHNHRNQQIQEDTTCIKM